MKIFITGGAGFIGSNLVDKLIEGNEITVYDNLSSGKKEFLKNHLEKANFHFIEADLRDPDKLKESLKGHDIVYHLAADPDVRSGAENTKTHFENNIIATHNLLEAMRETGLKDIVFTSTSTIYGEATVIPTPEDYGPLLPISIYAASKLSCEAMISSYCYTFGMRSWLFRFANIVGNRSTHGVIFDFINKLKRNSKELEILGDGSQSKSYMLVDDCLDSMLFAVKNSKDPVNIFNIGTEDGTNVTRIAEIVVEEMKLKDVKFSYTGGKRGWIGDVPKMGLSIDKIKGLGWKPRHNSEESIREAAKNLLSS